MAIDGPHHGEAGQRRLDEDQRQQLEAMGWIVVRADEFRLTAEPGRFIRQVQDALARAGGGVGAEGHASPQGRPPT